MKQNRCCDCKKRTDAGPCPGCGLIVCQLCAEREGEFCNCDEALAASPAPTHTKAKVAEAKLATAVHRAEVAEQRWRAVIDEASRLLSRDMPQMLFAHDKISVPIEAYNEMAAMAFRFAGYCKTAQDMIHALGIDPSKEQGK